MHKPHWVPLLGAWITTLICLGAMPALASLPLIFPDGDFRYRSVVEDSGSAHGRARMTFVTKDDRTTLVEDRRSSSGDKSGVYRLTVDKSSGKLVRWTQTNTHGKKVQTTTLTDKGARIEARVTMADGSVETDHVDRPEGDYTFVPLVKFFIGSEIAHGKSDGEFDVVIVKDGALQVVEIGFEAAGTADVIVAGKKRSCRRVQVGPTSMLLGLVVPPGEMCFSRDKVPVMLRGKGKLSRFSEATVTTLVKQTKGSPAPPSRHPQKTEPIPAPSQRE